MIVFKKCFGLLRYLVHKIWFHIKLRNMDAWWYFIGGNCFDWFPPSFYYTHTEEEIKRITDETMADLQVMHDEYSAKYNHKTQGK